MQGLMMRDDGLIRASFLSPCLFLARSPLVPTLPKHRQRQRRMSRMSRRNNAETGHQLFSFETCQTCLEDEFIVAHLVLRSGGFAVSFPRLLSLCVGRGR